MKHTVNKLFACVLALALALTGFGGPVAMVANAATEYQQITFRAVDTDGKPVSGLSFYLESPGEEDVDPIDISGVTAADGTLTFDPDEREDPDPDVAYFVLLKGDEYSIVSDSNTTLSIDFGSKGYVITTLNDEAYDGSVVEIVVEKESGEDPTDPPTESDSWTVEDFTFDEAGTTVTGLTESGKAKLMADSTLIIPDTNADGENIIGIGPATNTTGVYGTFAFDGEDGVKYEPTLVQLPANLETIGNFAFTTGTGDDQKGIEYLELPETVTTIGDWAFRNPCFTSVVIPDSVTSVGKGAFVGADANKKRITEATLSSGMTVVPQSMFTSQKISDVEIPEGVTKIDRMAFSGCGVSHLTLPSTLTEIGNQAFENNLLSELEIPASVTKIGRSAFKHFAEKTTAELSKITLNEGLVSIGKEAFANCKVTELQLPTTVTTLDVNAFQGCSPAAVLKTTVEDQAKEIGNYKKVIKAGTGHKVVYYTNELKVKVVDEEDNPVPGIKLYTDLKYNTFNSATGDDGVVTQTIGSFTKNAKIGVATEGYAAVDGELSVVCSGSPAKIDTVNGEAYDGIDGVVLKVKTVPIRVKTDTIKFKTVDADGNPVGNVKLYSNESIYNEDYEQVDIGEFVTAADGTYEYKINSSSYGNIRINVTDTEHTSDQRLTIVTAYDNKTYTKYVDTVNDKEYSKDDVIEIVVKGDEPAIDATTLKVKVVDNEGNPVSGLELILKAKGAPEGLAFRGATDAEGMTEYKCQGTADDDVELSDYPYEILLKDESTYKASSKPVVTFEEDDDWNTSFSEVDGEAYTGQIVTITVEKSVPSEPKDYYDEFTVTPGEKVEGATPITYSYTDWSEYPNSKTVKANVNLYTIRVPENAFEVKIDFNGNERIAYGYHNYDNKDGYDSYVNSCAADKAKGYKDNGAVGETTGTIRRADGKLPEYVFVQTPYVNGASEDLYVIKVETYPVDRIAGSTRYDTALNIADTFMVDKGVNELNSIIVTYGENFPDALAGGYLAKVKEAPIVIINDKNEDKIHNYIKDRVAEGGNVYLLGSESVVSKKFEDALKGEGYNVKRLGGATRYDTNIEILKEAGVKSADELLICRGDNFADSLSASAAGKPIFIVGQSLTDSQKKYLNEISPAKAYAIGGSNVLSDSVVNAVKKELKLSEVERIYGNTRYETSVEVAKKLVSENPERVYVTTGTNYPDGLAGGPLAYLHGVPLILVGTTSQDNAAAIEYCKNAKVERSIALGSESVVSEAVRTGMLAK